MSYDFATQYEKLEAERDRLAAEVKEGLRREAEVRIDLNNMKAEVERLISANEHSVEAIRFQFTARVRIQQLVLTRCSGLHRNGDTEVTRAKELAKVEAQVSSNLGTFYVLKIGVRQIIADESKDNIEGMASEINLALSEALARAEQEGEERGRKQAVGAVQVAYDSMYEYLTNTQYREIKVIQDHIAEDKSNG